METNRVEIKKTETKRMEPDLKLINMETVEVEQIEWLFYPFIPFGKVTIIQGDPGEGKTTMVLQIIANQRRKDSAGAGTGNRSKGWSRNGCCF